MHFRYLSLLLIICLFLFSAAAADAVRAHHRRHRLDVPEGDVRRLPVRVVVRARVDDRSAVHGLHQDCPRQGR